MNIDEGQPYYRLRHSALVRNVTTKNSATLSKPIGCNNLSPHQKGVSKRKKAEKPKQRYVRRKRSLGGSKSQVGCKIFHTTKKEW